MSQEYLGSWILIAGVALGILAYLGLLGWVLFRNKITGMRFLGFMVGIFALIIGVNLVLAFKAVATFPGLEVSNSYIASQDFDTERKAQIALGWTLTSSYEADARQLRLVFSDRDGLPVRVGALKVLVGRSTEAVDDSYPNFQREAGAYVAGADLGPGKWMMHVEGYAADGTLFRQRLDLFVKG